MILLKKGAMTGGKIRNYAGTHRGKKINRITERRKPKKYPEEIAIENG